MQTIWNTSSIILYQSTLRTWIIWLGGKDFTFELSIKNWPKKVCTASQTPQRKGIFGWYMYSNQKQCSFLFVDAFLYCFVAILRISVLSSCWLVIWEIGNCNRQYFPYFPNFSSACRLASKIQLHSWILTSHLAKWPMTTLNSFRRYCF